MSTGLLILTVLHTLISLIAIAAGFVVVRQLYRSEIDQTWTRTFLVTAIVTSVSGYFFPFGPIFTPGQKLGIVALIVLAIVLIARHVGRVAGAWRWIYAGGMVATLFFLLLVLAIQLFKHIAFLTALAPTGSEPPLLVTQVVVLLICVALGIGAVRKFRPMAV